MLPIRLVSFNVGTASDYKIRTGSENRAHYETAADHTFNKLVGLKPDVVCFQECFDIQERVANLAQSFKIIRYLSKNPDVALALSEDRFSDITDLSCFLSYTGIDLAIAKAVDKISKQTLLFASIHVPGYNIRIPDKDSTSLGDAMCVQLKWILESHTDVDLVVIGADMNSGKKILPNDLGQVRFQIFEEAGFTTQACGYATNIYEGEERELDYFLVQTKIVSVWKRLAQWFTGGISWTTSAPVVGDFSWTDNTFCSDHKPLSMSITPTQMPSIIRRSWNWVCSWIKHY